MARGTKVASTTTNVNNDITPRPAKHDDTTYLAVVAVAVVGTDSQKSGLEESIFWSVIDCSITLWDVRAYAREAWGMECGGCRPAPQKSQKA